MSEDLLMSAAHDDTVGSEMNDLFQETEGADGAEVIFSEGEVLPEGDTFIPDDPMGYGDFSLPEGMMADEGMDQGFRGLAKDLGLPKGSAQKLVDFYAEAQAKQVKEYHEQVQAWKDQVMSDGEMGGHHWSESQRHIARARDMLGGQEFVEFVESTGIGNHPALLRFCLRAGKLLSEDSAVDGSGRLGGRSRSAADVLFGDLG